MRRRGAVLLRLLSSRTRAQQDCAPTLHCIVTTRAWPLWSRAVTPVNDQKKYGGQNGRRVESVSTSKCLLFLFARSLRGQGFECEPQELAHAGIFLSREALQRRALICGDADGDLPVRIARRFAAIEIESGDSSTNDLACGGETMPFTAGLDSRDKRFGKIKRLWGRRLTGCFCHTTSGLKACDKDQWVRALARPQRNFLVMLRSYSAEIFERGSIRE